MFKKLQELIESGKITQELATEIDGEISILQKSLNDENAKLRVKYKELENAYTEGQNTLKTEYETKLNEAKKSANTELAKEYETKLNEAMAKGAELEEKAKQATLKATMTETLSKFDVVDMSVAEAFVRGYVVENDNGFGIKVGDETLSFENGVEKLLNERSFLLKPKGNAGSGATEGDGNGGNLSEKEKAFLEKLKKVKG